MKRKLQKGFTLVELVVVMILIGIITTALVMVIRPSNRISTTAANRADMESATITLSDYLNAELRYSTGIKVMFLEDGVTPAASDAETYSNFITLSNTVRKTDEVAQRKGARGTTAKGVTSDLTKSESTVVERMLSDYNFYFEITGFNTTRGSESLTLGVTGNLMSQNDAGNGFEIDESVTYEYDETFQLLNIQAGTALGVNTYGLTVGEDTKDDGTKYTEDDDYVIWILYTKTGASTKPSSSPGESSPPADHDDPDDPLGPGPGPSPSPTYNSITLHFLTDGESVEQYDLDIYHNSSAMWDTPTAYSFDYVNNPSYTSDSVTISSFSDHDDKFKVSYNGTDVLEQKESEIAVTELWFYAGNIYNTESEANTAINAAKGILGQPGSITLVYKTNDGNDSFQLYADYYDADGNPVISTYTPSLTKDGTIQTVEINWDFGSSIRAACGYPWQYSEYTLGQADVVDGQTYYFYNHQLYTEMPDELDASKYYKQLSDSDEIKSAFGYYKDDVNNVKTYMDKNVIVLDISADAMSGMDAIQSTIYNVNIDVFDATNGTYLGTIAGGQTVYLDSLSDNTRLAFVCSPQNYNCPGVLNFQRYTTENYPHYETYDSISLEVNNDKNNSAVAITYE